MLKVACEYGYSSHIDSKSIDACFDVEDSSCASKADLCVRNITQTLSTQLMTTHSQHHKRDYPDNSSYAVAKARDINTGLLISSVSVVVLMVIYAILNGIVMVVAPALGIVVLLVSIGMIGNLIEQRHVLNTID
ncbi:hypothetical protein CVIRNUC_003666 [Coccomyxa viridis]|uniref:Uncharacterized protein n=1 Tax=Coccomyxa viridis TaxID=1274662 RepID=A0AAV1I0X8_9CHLO|nr:hypothetical protein CVIRNUC_003666 [Coccomyxa viridis]